MAAFSFEAKAVACPSDLSLNWRVTNGRTITKEGKPEENSLNRNDLPFTWFSGSALSEKRMQPRDPRGSSFLDSSTSMK
jgi:hypothetical protein